MADFGSFFSSDWGGQVGEQSLRLGGGKCPHASLDAATNEKWKAKKKKRGPLHCFILLPLPFLVSHLPFHNFPSFLLHFPFFLCLYFTDMSEKIFWWKMSGVRHWSLPYLFYHIVKFHLSLSPFHAHILIVPSWISSPILILAESFPYPKKQRICKNLYPGLQLQLTVSWGDSTAIFSRQAVTGHRAIFRWQHTELSWGTEFRTIFSK